MDDLPSLQQLLFQAVFLAGVGVLVYFLTRWMKFRHEAWPYPHPQISAWIAIAITIVPWLFLTLIGLSKSSEGAKTSTPTGIINSPLTFFMQLIFYLILFGPAALAMKSRHESWQSAGITKKDLGKSILLGSLLSLIGILTSGNCLNGILAGLTMGHVWALLQFSVVGLGEEFGFRGYLQTRLCAWLGRWQGWLLASVWMALIHISGRILIAGLDPLAAFLSSAYLIPISMLLGYIMLRTDNIAAPAIYHTFADWVGIFY